MTLSKFEKGLIDEVATLSGYPELMVREVIELTFLRQLEFMMNRQDIRLPFIGVLKTEYLGEEYESGNRVAQVRCSITPSDLFKRIVGDIEDGESNLIKEFLDAKMETEVQQILEA